MKKKDVIMIMTLAIAAIIAVIALSNVDQQAVKDWFTNLTAAKSTKVATDGESQQQDTSSTETTPKAEPNQSELPESFADQDGKVYYQDGRSASNLSLQERLDSAVMANLNVYDIVRENDSIVVIDGKEVSADYGIDLSAEEKVAFFRDGYHLLTYSEDEDKFFKDESSTHIFKGASDSVFTDAVFCDKDAAIRSKVCVGYVNAKLWGVNKEYGCKGWFKMNLLDSRIFKAFVLVKRAVVLEDGRTANMFTWAVRVCDGEVKQADNGGKVNDGNKPSDKPTAEPTIQPTHFPTEAPTTAPTIEPTIQPTHSPTEAPTTAPTIEPTAKPTHSPTEAPQPTHSPTEAPTAAPTEEPTQQPSYKPTPVPEVTPEPTNRHSDTGDGGSGNSHSPMDDGTDDGTSGGNRHSGASDSGTRHSEP